MRSGRIFTQEEERAHVLTHSLGILFILVVGPMLIIDAPDDNRLKLGLLTYIFSFAFVFSASACYHFTKPGIVRDRMRVVDHIAIYYFIAGTNAPFLLGLVERNLGFLFFGIMGVLVLFGTVYKIIGARYKFGDTNRFAWFSLFFYLLLGWLGVLTVFLIYPKVGIEVLFCIILGGVFYTIGTYFYKYDFRKWYHTIWHILVLCGALAHFWAIWKVAG